MTSKIDVRQIVLDHFLTLHRQGEKRIGLRDVTLFYVVPVAAALLAVLGLGLRVNEGLANALFTGVSIFAGLLFNVQLLVYDNVRHIRFDEDELPAITDRRRKRFTELYSNVSYSILICLLIIILVLLFNLTFEGGWLQGIRHQIEGWLNPLDLVVQCLVLAVAVHFILTMFMVLKRVHFLLSKEMAESA